MKKLLLFLALLVSYNIGLSQNKVIIKGTQLSISSLAPMSSFSIVGNNTGSPAVPVAISLGIGLTFDHGLLAIDTLHFKDTVFAVNGLSVIGNAQNTIGLGGRLQQATNISGANAWGLTYDSFPAASGSGFRVNFLNDAPWDLIVRDSATGYWTRIPKGTPGQVLSMLSTGGIGWGAGGGGGGNSVGMDTVQSYSSGSTLTQSASTNYIQVNPSSAQSTLTITTLGSSGTWHTSNDLYIVFGGTVTGSNAVITNITIAAGSGITLVQAINPNGLTYYAGDVLRYHKVGNLLYRIN
jgi:hypothetical protein